MKNRIGLLVALTLVGACHFSTAADRSYGAGRIALTLDGISAGFVHSYQGGGIVARVDADEGAPGVWKRKHISHIAHEPFTVELDPSALAPEFVRWLEESAEGLASLRDVGHGSRTFHDAFITEVTVPALDGSSKEPAYFTVKIDAEHLRHSRQIQNADPTPPPPRLHGPWLASDFRLEMGDLPTDRVAKIDSFTIKQTVIKDEVGMFREPTKHPGKVEVPNLTFTIPVGDVGPWAAWFEGFVIDGRNDDADELSGAIVLLAADGEEELGRIDLHQVGIVSLTPVAIYANPEGVLRVKVECYVEEIRFDMYVTDA